MVAQYALSWRFFVLSFTTVSVLIKTPVVAVEFLRHPVDHSATEGKTGHVTCIFKDIDHNMTDNYDVIWTINSYIISEANGFNLTRIKFTEEHGNDHHRYALMIHPVTREDKGWYRCFFQYNGEILISSKNVKLSINEVPSQRYPIATLDKGTYLVDEEVRVSCFSEKTRPLHHLRWGKITSNRLGPTQKKDNGTHIWIEATTRASESIDGSFYECLLHVKYEHSLRVRVTPQLHLITNEPTTKQEIITAISVSEPKKYVTTTTKTTETTEKSASITIHVDSIVCMIITPLVALKITHI